MKLSDFDYDLPVEAIAQRPARPRDHSRLLVLGRESGVATHHHFYDVLKFLRPGDLLVFNNTKVFKARLLGKIGTIGIEIFLLRPCAGGWEALARPGRKTEVGDFVIFNDAFSGQVCEKMNDGRIVIDFALPADEVMRIADKIGHIPVPPYIKREPEDFEEYQTIFAERVGSVAAPTASFHFTKALMEKIRGIGVEMAFLTLHVGLGTFKPVQTENILDHIMHAELVEIDADTAGAVSRAKAEGRRVIAVGTTVVRALEGAGNAGATRWGAKRADCTVGGTPAVAPYSGEVNIFITPGYRFQIIDGLITNFHLPKSTLLILVSAFAGRERVLAAYKEAIAAGYRFYSFGDAMLVTT